MKNLRGLKRAGALCLACLVLALFSADAYLQASENSRSDAITAEEETFSSETVAEQTDEVSTERLTEATTEQESEKQTSSAQEFQTELADGETEPESQADFAEKNIESEEQTETQNEKIESGEPEKIPAEDAEKQTEVQTEVQPEKQPEIQQEMQTEVRPEDLTENQTEEQTGSMVPEPTPESEPEITEKQSETASNLEAESDTELTVEDVLEEAQRQNIDFLGLAPGESMTFYMPVGQENGIMTMAVTSVTVARSSVPYNYADYGYGTLQTYRYVVSFNDIVATAYCVQPTRSSPGSSSSYGITKLKGAKTLAKVCYYGTKAAGDEGFFAERYPSFSEGQRFIITHIAAAYANGSPDAFTGASLTARALALELYEYCVAQPNIPEVDMEFSDADVKAYIDYQENPKRQRTKNITFDADELQTITFKLPSGVKLHNVSTGKVSAAGEKVTISGGTKFYLSAPLSQAVDVGAKWSSTMKGSIKKDYSAYKITTYESQQDLALVFGEGLDEERNIDFSVKWIEPIEISIHKVDEETNTGLSGAVFGVYTDKDCTNLITKLPETDESGTSSATLFWSQDAMYLKELVPPAGYMLNEEIITAKITGKKQTLSYTVADKKIKARLRLIKKDAQTDGGPQGDAVLENAVYGLYAREDIAKTDGSNGVLFHAGEQVATLTTDREGKASVDNLNLGKYYVKEISPSKGYLLDEKEYDVSFEAAADSMTVIEKECISHEMEIRQPFQLIKIAENGKTDAELLEGAGFTAYLVSSLKTREDGSYDFASASPVVLGPNGETELFTDKQGYAISIPLPFGTYIVRETTVPAGFAPVDDFEVRITENSPDKPQAWRILRDEEFEAKLKIIKSDDETQRNVLKKNTEFKVYDIDAGAYVEQVTYYPKEVKHTSYFTDEDGSLTLPQSLPRGHYRIEEVAAPDGYTLGEGSLEVTVDGNMAYRTDDISHGTLVEVVASNHPVKGELIVRKKGPVLSGYDDDFVYEEVPLSGAVYEVYAAENIYTADGQRDETGERILEYAKDAIVGTITTGENGEGTLKNLPLGKYKIVEKTAPDGYVCSSEEQFVEFVYVDQETPVVVETAEFVDDLQKAVITIIKKNALDGAALAGAKFGLYAKDDIAQKGKTLIEADTLLATAVTDEDGKAVFDCELPFGTYYAKELQAPEGFLPTEEVADFTFSYDGQEMETVQLEAVFENRPTTVEITKADITTGVELDGASLSVMDREGNVIDAWVSERDNPHSITGLRIGETYKLREELAPYGYLRAEEVEFTVTDTGMIQEVKMEDAVPVGRIIISKTGEFVNSVTGREMMAGTLEAAFRYISGSLEEVVFEVYAAEDIKAADGVSEDYYKKDALVATITTDALGYARTDDLPLGKYYVVEKKTAEGFVLDGEPREIDLTYRDQDTPVVLYDEEWQNSRQKVSVTVQKKEKGTDQLLSGCIFALCAGEDIAGRDGKILMKEDTVIEKKTTGKDGRIVFSADLPIGGTYYIKEVKAPAGYAKTNKIKRFTFSYAGENTEQVTYDFTFENRPTRVKVSKTDITTGDELPGARLQVRDKKGRVVDEWTSGTSPHMIQGLEAGKTYTLREETAPKGYLVAEEVTFKVKNTGKIQSVVMKDAREEKPAPETDSTPKPDSAPKTGDDTDILFWLALMAVSASVLAFWALRYTRKKRLS